MEDRLLGLLRLQEDVGPRAGMYRDADAQRGVDPLDAEPAVLFSREDLAFGPDADVEGEFPALVVLWREMDRGAGEGLAISINQPSDRRAPRGEPALDRALARPDQDRAGEPPVLVDECGRARPAGLEALGLERGAFERLDLPVGGQSIGDDIGHRLAVGIDQPAFSRCAPNQ